MNKRIGVFSYGSGLASSFFSIRVCGSLERFARNLDLRRRLVCRRAIAPSDFSRTMLLREERYNRRDYVPAAQVQDLFAGTYYLASVDEKFRRSYLRKEIDCSSK